MLNKILKSVIISAVLVFIVIPGGLALATNGASADGTAKTQGLKDASGRLKNIEKSVYGPENKAQPIEKVVGGIIQTGLTLIGVIFLVLTVYGGFIWMTARGEEAEAKRAKGILTMALIGLLVVVGAYAITAFVVGRLLVAGGLPT